MKNTSLCYIERGGQYLMLHRVKKAHDENEGKWIGVGGKFEPGESPEECMQREMLEETGLTAAAWRYRGIVTFVSDANVAAAGTLGAALELGGAALPYAVTAETQDAAGADRITLTAIVTPTTAQPLTVINSSGSSNTYTNSTLTVVKLA